MMKNYQLRRQNPDLAPKKYEVKLVNKRGEILNAILDIGIISNTKEMVVSIIDITASKKAEEKLRKSEEQYRILFENTGTSLLIVEEDTTISLANEEFARRTGYTRSEIEGVKSWKDIVYREDIDRMFAQHQLRRVSSAAALSSYEFRYRNKAGELHYAIVNAQMVPGTKKSTVSILDITERKRAEDALKESEQKYRNIFENIQNVYYETSMDGTILEISPSIYILSKRLYRREDLLGQNMFKFYTEPERRKILLQELKKTERLEDFDIELKIQDGSLIQCALTCRLIRDENKQPKKIIGTMRNITERKQFEKELIRAKEHAEESDRLKSAFLANMSHEIRTPMNGILGFAELLKEPHLTGEEQQEYINIIEKSGARMLNIINDIVSISKIESGQMKISISATNINEQIQFIYAFFTPEAEKRGLLLSVKNILPSEESIIKTDHEKLYAVLTNLVNNAIKYTHIGSIEFGVKKKGSYLEFFVKDTGVGIHQDQMEIIFERFRQGNDLNTRYIEGAGLGLSISKAYVEMLGGKIWVESELGKGSIFYFTLPYSSESEAKTVSKEVPSGIRTDHQAKDLKILIVEDDESSEMLITFTIKKICKEFLKVGTGVEAVKACRNNPDIDLVLMDIKMPIMDGYEATRQIRQFNKNVVIIAQTAYGLAGDREKAIEAGCNDYISKPIKIDELKGLIQKHFHK
jgi:PAS domain S-box-containing protein